MKELIFNADDFGYSRGVNHGIIDAHRYGVVTSATMMMNMPGTEHAVELLKEHETLGVGIHLVLTCGKAVSKNLKQIVDEQNMFFKSPKQLLEKELDFSEIETELRSQIEKFYSFGLKPTHLDSHHHCHTFMGISSIVETLAVEYDLPVRRFPGMIKATPFSDQLITDFYGENISEKTLDSIVEHCKEGTRSEVMVHPAYLDYYIVNHSSYLNERLKELEILTNWKVPNHVKLAN